MLVPYQTLKYIFKNTKPPISRGFFYSQVGSSIIKSKRVLSFDRLGLRI